MYKFQKWLISFCYILTTVKIYSQSTPDQQIAVLKNVVPPSPNSSSLGKYGEWPVSLYTGIPNISLPICELKGRTISIPVSLSYHASGNRVGDISSWIGLGWTLNAGGAITRSIRGLPDDASYFQNAANFSNPNDFGSSASANTKNLMIVASAKNNTDTQEDIYTLNALGKSYQFVLRADGSIQTIPYSNIKLISNPLAGTNTTTNTWTILLEDGTKLLFGGNNYIETTNNPRFPLGDGKGVTFISSWMLQTVTSPYNETITFAYTPNSTAINHDSYYSQSDYIEYKTSISSCSPVNESTNTKSTIERQQIFGLNLSTIESALGRVEFVVNSTERQDLPGSNALQEIKVFSKLANKYIEDYLLNTSYTTAISSTVLTDGRPNEDYLNYRLRLNSLEKKDISNLSATGMKWIFDYNTQNLPARRSFAQDHWGFFNGATTNTTLLPPEYFRIPSSVVSTLGTDPTIYGFMPDNHNLGADREGNETYLQAEILTAIHYPTGGYTNFAYKANIIPAIEEKFVRTNLNVNLNLYAGQSNPSSTASVTFTVTKPQYINISATSSISQSILNDQPSARTATRILDQNGNVVVGITGTDNQWFNLLSAGTYTLQAWTNVDPYGFTGTDNVTVNATLNYEKSNGTQSYNKLVGGLHIDNIADYDGNSTTPVDQKFYIYESPLVINPVDIINDYITAQTKQTHNASTGENCYFTTVTRNSSSRFSLGSIQGGTVAYGKVTTLHGVNGVNGQTVSIFNNGSPPGAVKGDKIKAIFFGYARPATLCGRFTDAHQLKITN